MRDAETKLDLSEAGGHLTDAVRQVGLEKWPFFLRSAQERAQLPPDLRAGWLERLPPLRGARGRAARSMAVPVAGTKNRLVPDPQATGPHSTFRRAPDGVIHNYETYDFNEHTGKYGAELRYRGDGKGHGPKGKEVPTPFILERDPGSGVGQKPNIARPALPAEIPRGSGRGVGAAPLGNITGGGVFAPGGGAKGPFRRLTPDEMLK